MLRNFIGGICLSIVMANTAMAMVIDAPHNEAVSGIRCGSCHTYSLWWKYSPAGAASSPSRGEISSTVCLQCHNTPDGPIPYKQAHSSVSFGATAQHGEWSTNCTDCHNPHFQGQLDWLGSNSNELYLVTGTIGAAQGFVVNGNTTTFSYTTTEADPLWTDPATWTNKTGHGRSLILVDNTQQAANTYSIVAADANTITVKGGLTATSAGHTFGLIYGQLIKSSIATPHGGTRPVKFFDPKKTFSVGGFTEPSLPEPQGICQVCHTATKYWHNDGSQTDHNPGESCTKCHPATDGFAHGGGASGGGTGCQGCHGKDASEGGHGTTLSHATHTASDANHLKGPHLTCDACHDTNNFPFFKSGTDGNGDGKFSLAETDVCTTCHSPDGTYDGVNDPAVGAKTNWHDGIYETDTVTLKSGKARWCATCHDESPSVINGIAAPNVVGDEDATSTYGTGYGYYKTGHGLTTTEHYPSSGSATAGAGLGCPSCHDLSLVHTDGKGRTFGCEDGCDSSEYRNGYRLQLVNGQAPMQIPLTGLANDTSQFRLCYRCHDSGPFLDPNNLQTNLISTGSDGTKNRHQYHLSFANQLRYPADYNYAGASNSRITCVTCHNVHGSSRLAMVNDGRLINREPGLRIWYHNPEQVTYNPFSSNPPTPESVPLTASTGTLISYASSTNLCSHCHGNSNVTAEERTPYQNMAVTSTDPANGGAEVPLNRAVTINWSKAIDCSTVTTSTVTITPAVDWAMTACSGSQAIFTPSNQSGATLYTVTISSSVKNTEGGAMALSYPFSYTTTAPTVATPTMGTPAVLSTTAIQWNFSDTATNEVGFQVHAPDHTVQTGEATPNLSSLTETGLTANTEYTRHLHSYTTGEVSQASSDATAYTLPVVPEVTADQATATWHLTSEVIFSNAAGFGSGGVHYYRYAWDTSATHTFNDTEPQWTTGSLTKTATTEGSWFLHVKSYNGDHVANPATADYGPYQYNGVVLAVSATSPSPGETSAVVDSLVTIDFNESVDCATVTPETITITPSVAWTRTSCSGSQAVFAPNGQGPATAYTVSVSTSVTDANRIPLSASHQFSYTTGAEGSVVTVCQAGPPACGFATIQGAINDAGTTNGKVVRVTDSATYLERINFNGKLITLQSANGAANTTIAGDGSNNPVVTFNSGETASAGLDGFTIDNQAAASTLTRGIAISASAAPTIKNCRVTGNALSTGNGAGISINGGAASIQHTTLGGNAANKNSCASGCGLYATALSGPLFINNSTIAENTATSIGAGIWLAANGAQSTTITATTFTNNTATQSGGAIYNNASILSVNGGDFTTNTAGANQNGGAIYSTGAAASTTIANTTFTSNSSGSSGGAIYITGSSAASPLAISNSTFTGNTATANGGALAMASLTNPATLVSTTITGSATTNNKGGGIYAASAPLTLTDTTLANNTAALEGGGIYATGAPTVIAITNGSLSGNTATVGGGVYLTTSSSLTATGTAFTTNRATASYGGGIYTSSTLTLTRAVVSGNRTNQRGGGLYVAGGTTTLTNCNVTGNTADGQAYSTGGGIHDQAGTVLINNSTMAGNYATSSGGGIYASSTNDVIRNSIVWGNTAASNAQINNGWPTTTYTDIQGGCPSCLDKTGNLDLDPQFIDLQQAGSGAPATVGNFHLCAAMGLPDAACTTLSPCIDTAAATNAPANDRDGDSRPTDIPDRGDGTDDYDMGADEYRP